MSTNLLHVLSGLIVILSGAFCVGLGAAIFLNPAGAQRFLGQFAQSAFAHFAEQLARLCAGGAMIIFSPLMIGSNAFRVFGWILVITSIILMLIPWRAHRRFAQWSFPWITSNLRLYAAGALALGALVLYSASPGLLRAIGWLGSARFE